MTARWLEIYMDDIRHGRHQGGHARGEVCIDRGRAPFVREGCGHLIDDHSNALKCRVCGAECGIHCRGDL